MASIKGKQKAKGHKLRRYNEPQSMVPCSECSIGMMHKAKVTYFTWLADEMITVPDFPAWICDVCGKREYDVEALNNLALLLSPLPGKTPARKASKPAAKSDSPTANAQSPSPE